MNISTQQALAEQFHRLHEELLVLPNAWDPPSAHMVAAAGAKAVATTSAGVAWSLGLADAGGMDRSAAMDAARRLISSVTLPVTLDVEDGYADEPGGVAATIEAVIAAGAVGINIEDSRAGTHLAPDEFTAVLDQAVAAVAASPVDVFVNARVDTFLLGAERDKDDLLAETIERAVAYAVQGAHGIFVPGVTDPDTIRALVHAVDVPLNVMVGAGSPPVIELAALGVRRVSWGPQLALSAYGQVGAWAHAMRAGHLDQLPPGVDIAEFQSAFAAQVSTA